MCFSKGTTLFFLFEKERELMSIAFPRYVSRFDSKAEANVKRPVGVSFRG
jgi:hypothetical protein